MLFDPRYNQLGRISCIVCGVQIKSEHAWNAHILGKSHKQNESREVQASAKRSTESTPAVPIAPMKKPKLDETNLKPLAPESHSNRSGDLVVTGVRERDPASLGEKNPSEKSRTNSTSGSKLPEGFFDDRYKDAKARNVPYKDKFAEELEFFQKEMGSLEKESEIIMEKESEAMISSRELEEIDTQM
ncbi:Zinc finger protein [Fasciolopsis buskii]|uniref:Zinc finger protein 830 n=1 Tax=Fasciolopsis buskii TaxID=27845 RepID=A0A8E0VLI2_9TREM|nr:Zinc finger protein [Fasciolopsis buski]